MVLPLISFESLHGILNGLLEDMMPLCGSMTSVASAIAGLGAMLYICYRVWKALANAEPIDLFPLLRPFALGICIVFFQSLVLGGINDILSPIVKGTNRILTGQTFDMRTHRKAKDELERQNLLRNPETAYLASDEEFDRQISALGWSPNDLNTMEKMYEERALHGLKGWIVKAFRWILEIVFEAASLVIDTIRTFYLVVLSILGPIAFAISVFDGFQATLTQWLCKYVTVYLWLPVRGRAISAPSAVPTAGHGADGYRPTLLLRCEQCRISGVHDHRHLRLLHRTERRLVDRAGRRLRLLQPHADARRVDRRPLRGRLHRGAGRQRLGPHQGDIQREERSAEHLGRRQRRRFRRRKCREPQLRRQQHQHEPKKIKDGIQSIEKHRE